MAPLGPGLPLQAGMLRCIIYLINNYFLSNINHCSFLLLLIAPLMPNGLPANRATLQSQREITIANDLIGCIIGRGGQKISEIR